MILSGHTEINEGVPSTRVPGLEGEQYRHGISYRMMLRLLKAPNQSSEGEQQKGAVLLLSLQARGGFLEEVAFE